ncbi:winged helix-turn-helix domain-containing protein [Alkalimonas amylolytica]|uniref:DNA-binding winged helix-turn-helix (WHTH) domain-containing protein n=1 Tax=Alkalimonas amylolytica TaxID=152573 RepID=A0A1H4D590_ALKAM|nr:winged helix-turn-helix domain-containing protein [Alkalimonas amylolytica]SEA67738.1 DNA-binding winged helix-turn-helix (wHTH) domain-containing protein [Alkalimonas amylolytica]
MYLGPWKVNPEDYSIQHGQQRCELEPLLFKLLLYFVEHPRQILSRQQLIDAVWQQSYVDDNAINRAISELRKVLQHPDLPQSPIKTHHRKGYSLQLDVSTSSSLQSQSSATHEAGSAPALSAGNSLPIAKKWWWGSALTLLILISSLAFWQGSSNKAATSSSQPAGIERSELTISQQQKVTWYKGVESRPLLSTDKSLLAFNHTQPDGSIRTIVRSLLNPLSLQDLVLEREHTLISLQSWQPGSRQLLTMELGTQDGSCSYRLYQLEHYPLYEARTLSTCKGLVFGVAQLSSDGKTLYYTESANGPFTPASLMAKQLESGNHRVLLSAPESGIGASVLALSRSGERLAYLYYNDESIPHLYLYDPASREHQLLYRFSFSILLLDLSWSLDDRYLVVPANDALVYVDVHTKEMQLKRLPDGTQIGELSLYSDHQAYTSPLTISSNQHNFHIVKVSLDDDDAEVEVTPLLHAAGNTMAIALDPTQTDRSVFSADFTGSWQLWLQNKDGLQQLTELAESSSPIADLSWSPNGRMVAFSQAGNLYVLDIQQQHLRQKSDQSNVGRPVWKADSSGLYLVKVQQSGEYVWSYDLFSEQWQQKSHLPATHPVVDATGQLHYHRAGQLMRYVDGGRQDSPVLAADERSQWFPVMRFQQDAIYRFNIMGTLARTLPGNPEQTQIWDIPYQIIQLQPDPHSANTVFLTIYQPAEQSIKFVEWR